MPELKEYTYNIVTDFTNSIVNVEKLFNEATSSTIVTALDRIDTSDGYLSIWYKDTLSNDDVASLNTIISDHDGSPSEPSVLSVDLNTKDSNGVPIFAPQPRVGSETIHASVNFCDKSSWFSGSNRVVNEVLTDIGDGYSFNGDHDSWIDMKSGRVLDEEKRIAEQQAENTGDPHGYSVIIKSDGYIMTEREPFATTGGDFEVYYEDGYVKFFESQAGKVITADHSYATSSLYILKPKTGKILNVEGSEIDFSTDIVMNDSIYYTVFGYVEIYAPQYLIANGGPYAPGTLIPLTTKKYKRLAQILKESSGSYPIMPRNCANVEDYDLSSKDFRKKSRGIKSGWTAIPFKYSTIRQLQSSRGLEIHVGLDNDNVFFGENATITFYCTSENE